MTLPGRKVLTVTADELICALVYLQRSISSLATSPMPQASYKAKKEFFGSLDECSLDE